MKKFFMLFFLCALASPSLAFAQKPVNLNESQAVRHKKCLVKVAVFINGQAYAFSRLKGMEYTKKDGPRVTVKNPEHPWNNCDLTNLGEVIRFSTGLMKSGVNMHIEYLTDEAAKKNFITTYADRREAILDKMKNDDVKLMDDYTTLIKWTSSIMYTLPGSAVTGNEEPVAIYCKLPAGVKDLPSVPREEKRKLCSTRYILPGGLGFGYNYLEGIREYKPTVLDKSIRDYFVGTAIKAVNQAPPAP
jgi:hypothetical protein